MMFITTIRVSRVGYYGGNYGNADVSKPFAATIEVQGQHGKVELTLSQELSERVVAIIADEVAAAGRATAEAMTAEALTVTALPAPEGAF